MYRDQQALITGGAGFIGSQLARELDNRGVTVRILDDLSSGRKENLRGVKHDFILGSVLDTGCLYDAMKGIDVVFHMAGFVSVPDSFAQESKCMAINHLGTLNTLRAAGASSVRRVLFSGTAAVYGDSPLIPSSEKDRTAPSSPYALSKLAAEQLVVEWGQNTELDTVSLRLFNVYGRRVETPPVGVVNTFTSSIKTKGYGTILGDGLNTRDFVFIDDVVQAMIQAGYRKERLRGEILNIGSGISTSVLNLHNIIASKVMPKSINTPRPMLAAKRQGDVAKSLASIEKAKSELRWNPRFSLERGISKMLDERQ
tara:strand:+ start:69 stop:1007 length:939 start_codon:yes stop_codon:yes gene_type:complete